MKHQHHFSIGDCQYETMHFTPTKALRLMITIGKILGQPLSALFTADGDMAAESVIPVIVGGLTDRLEEKLVIDTIKEIFIDVRVKSPGVESHNVEFDLDFQGKLVHMFKALGEILKFQYADFFDVAGVKGLVRGLTPKAKQ